MKAFALPSRPKALVFDIDGTLYTSPEYVEEQVRVQIEKFGALKGWTYEEALSEIDKVREAYSGRTGGKRTSLANSMLELGIPIEESIRWREELLEPEAWLAAHPGVNESLRSLSASFRVCAVTNNTEGIGRRTLRAIGIEDRFEFVVGLDACGVSKPAREPFDLALRKLGLDASECISIGDRFDVDIEVPLAMGMGGILVSGAEDILELPGFLLKAGR